jgi:hypothetical protein
MLILFSLPWEKAFERFLMKMDLPPIGIQLQGTLLPFAWNVTYSRQFLVYMEISLYV